MMVALLSAESIRVPLFVRARGFPCPQAVTQPVLNNDLAPAIVQFADLASAPGLDCPLSHAPPFEDRARASRSRYINMSLDRQRWQEVVSIYFSRRVRHRR
jgi:arylsulfatase A-like enzyme